MSDRGTFLRRGDRSMAWIIKGAAACALGGIVLLFVMIFAFAFPVLAQSSSETFSWIWRPSHGQFGILPMVGGSLLLATCGMCIAWPVAFSLCCWSLAVGRPPLVPVVQAAIRLMTAVPTVVYGFAAVFLVTPFVRQWLGGSGMGLVTASFMVALLILPTMVLVLEAGLRPRLEELCPGCLAVGFSRLELLWFFAVPKGRKVLFSAAMLGFGRAIGDTMLPLMLAGNAPHLPEVFTDSMRTLTAHMALVTANEVGGGAYDSLFVAGAFLLCANTLVSLLLRRLGGR